MSREAYAIIGVVNVGCLYAVSVTAWKRRQPLTLAIAVQIMIIVVTVVAVSMLAALRLH